MPIMVLHFPQPSSLQEPRVFIDTKLLPGLHIHSCKSWSPFIQSSCIIRQHAHKCITWNHVGVAKDPCFHSIATKPNALANICRIEIAVNINNFVQQQFREARKLVSPASLQVFKHLPSSWFKLLWWYQLSHIVAFTSPHIAI